MAKCSLCGKKGLFLRLNNGICKDCESKRLLVESKPDLKSKQLAPTVISSPVKSDL